MGLCYVLRFIGYANLPPMPHTWVVLPVQLLHGITFGLYWTVGVSYAAASAPAGLEATLQGAFAALISAAQILALLVGGRILDLAGGAGLYGGAAVVALGVSVVPSALLLHSRCCRPPPSGRATARRPPRRRPSHGGEQSAAAAADVLNGFDDIQSGGAARAEEDEEEEDGRPPLVSAGALTSTGERK